MKTDYVGDWPQSTGSLMILSSLALAVIFLLLTVVKAHAQETVCRDQLDNVIPCWWLNDPGGSGVGGGSGNPNGRETGENFDEDFDEIIDTSKLQIESVERGVPLRISGVDFTPNATIYLNLYRNYPEKNFIEPIYQQQVQLDASGNFTLDLSEIPTETPGGEFLVMACQLTECSTTSVLENLNSPTAIIGQRFELPYLFNFEQEAVVTDEQALIEAVLAPTDDLVTPEELNFQLYKDQRYTITTHDFSQSCSEALKSACEAGLNLLFPHVHYDTQTEKVEVFPVGAYLKQANPAWRQYLGETTFVPGTYEIQSVVNGVPEDTTAVEVTPP